MQREKCRLLIVQWISLLSQVDKVSINFQNSSVRTKNKPTFCKTSEPPGEKENPGAEGTAAGVEIAYEAGQLQGHHTSEIAGRHPILATHWGLSA